jgi:hypothetical protein
MINYIPNTNVNMIKKKLLIAVSIFFFLTGCAVPGPKFIYLSILSGQFSQDLSGQDSIKTHDLADQGKIGIIGFKDKRLEMEKGYVGHRILVDKSQETYLVRGLNLASTLTGLSRTYLEKKSYSTTQIPALPLTLAGMDQAPKGIAYILSADINKFECRAQKKGATTDMVMEIDLTFFLGNIQGKKLSTIPVALTLERTELTFTAKKLEKFINQAFKEILEKALSF